MQRTIGNITHFEGIGLHSGELVRLSVHPAGLNFGIRFRRVDLPDGRNEIPARFDFVDDTRLNTRISNAYGAHISTIEHLMAAFAGMGVSNALVEVDGPEIPVLDGSSKEFVEKLWDAGLVDQGAFAPLFKVVKPLRVTGDQGAFAEFRPCEDFILDLDVDFADSAIGKQALSLNMANGVFVRELSDCRTFTRYSDVQTLQKNGLGLGGSLDNAVVVHEGHVLNSEGFRRPDECVRHKMLDALGDLYLAGAQIVGLYRGHKTGHALTNQLLRQAFAQDALIAVDQDRAFELEGRLPGFQLEASDFAVA